MERERFLALDTWRGICALIVVLFHFPVDGVVRAFPLVANGYLFVDFFFVLSGFVIATAYEGRIGERNAALRFVLRRFGRLWPLHVAMLAILVAISLLRGTFGGDDQHSAVSVLTNVLMIHGLGLEPTLTWNGPSWSISVEWALYLVFSLLASLKHRRLIYVALVIVGAWTLFFRAPFQAASTFDYGFFRGLAGFFTGALLIQLPRIRLGPVAEVLSVGLVGVFVCVGHLLFLAPVVFGAAVYVFANSTGAISRLLTWSPMARLGEWSYSTYMVHTLFAATLWNVAGRLRLESTGAHLLAPNVGVELALALGYLGVTVATSAVTYALIERPGRDWFNRLATARFPPQPKPAEQSA